jgi:hypothetical protein
MQLPDSFNTGYNFVAYHNGNVVGEIGRYSENASKYVNFKASNAIDSNNETYFTVLNHGFNHGDFVSYEPIGDQTLVTSNGAITYDTELRVVMNGVSNNNHVFKLAETDTQLDNNQGSLFTNKGNDAQVLKLNSTSTFDGSGNRTTTGVFTAGTGRYNKFWLKGDWRNLDFSIGYQYTMKVDLPTIYYTTKDGENFRSDSSANTIIHRIKMGFGPVGKYKAIVTSNFPTLANPSGKIYEEEFETIAITHDAGTTGQTTSIEIQDDVQQRVIPIYQKNKNATLTIESTHPTPATIHNLTWEGVYTPPYYTRV